MAIGSSGKSYCPTCGATANSSNIGRDGSPRTMGLKPVEEYEGSTKRRNRAASLRKLNERNKKR